MATNRGLFCFLAALTAACGDREVPRTRRARPVTVLELRRQDPTRTAAVTGSAEAYREEQIAFEVAGRVDLVVSVGTEVEGTSTDERGRVLKKGDLVARLDATRYLLRVEGLKAKLEATRKSLQAQEIEVREVATAELTAVERDLDAARAALTLARTNLDKAKRLKETGAGTQQDVDDAQGAYDQALARRQQTEASLDARRGTIQFKQAQLGATRAQTVELEASLEQAERDVADCELRAPFAGRITALHAGRGAIVQAGTPVATLTMIDPMKVSVAVSADMDRRLRRYDRAEVRLRDPLDPSAPRTALYGVILDKGEIADAATRTFRIDVLVRNERRTLVPEAGVPVVDQVLPLVTRFRGEEGDLYAGWDAIARDDEGRYVLHLMAPRMGEASALPRHQTVPVEKVRVVPGEEYFAVGRWYFRRLADAGGLQEGDPLVIVPKKSEGVLIDDPDRVFGKGVLIGGKTWLLRPGELVPVVFTLSRQPEGYYAPMQAIRELNGGYSVFVVRDGVARRVPVTLHETFGELRRIEGDGLAEGDAIVVKGVHYLGDGDSVDVVGEEQER